MKTLVIDFRMHNASGIGTYIKNIIPLLLNKFNVILLVNFDEMSNYSWIDKVDIIDTRTKTLTIVEQFVLPFKIPKCDYFWSPQYNIPVFFINANQRIVTIHDLYHLAFKDVSVKQKLYARLMVNIAIWLSNYIFTVSNKSKQEIKKYTKTKKEISITYNAIDNNSFKKITNENILLKIKNKYNLPNKFLLFVGNIKPHKNLKNLLFAMQNIDCHLVIVGSSNLRTNDKEVLNTIDTLKDKVIFTNYVDDYDLPAIYNLATIFVFPSLYEGFGIPPMEAQSCHTPVLCSDIEVLREVYQDSVLYFDPADIINMSKIINNLLNNKQLQNELVSKGLKNIHHFSWQKSVNNFIQHLR
jgi:glycosyltransferase involved in cell wall biosynthesis